MHIGFTGTQKGMTPQQEVVVLDLYLRYYSIQEENWLHHGDCIGSDAQAHKLALEANYKVHIHPPSNPIKRAYCKNYDKIAEPFEYLVRNTHIVYLTSVLIATPGEFKEQLRSGTWSTIRKARGAHRKIVHIVYPNGKIG